MSFRGFDREWSAQYRSRTISQGPSVRAGDGPDDRSVVVRLPGDAGGWLKVVFSAAEWRAFMGDCSAATHELADRIERG